MKGYRITPGLVINKEKNKIILNNTFNGYQLEYDDLSILEIFNDFNQIDLKEELYKKYPNDILDELFEYNVFEKKISFIKNMNHESCFRIFVFNKNIKNLFLWKYTNQMILYLSIPVLIIGIYLSRNSIFDLIQHFHLKYLISLLFGFLPFCFLHEFGHCISALANKAIVYDLGYYSKGINFGFYVFYEQANTKKGNIQISLSGAFFCFLICGILLMINHFIDNHYLLIVSLFYTIFNFTNLLVFQGFDGYNAIYFYLDIENIESKLKYLMKHPCTSKYNKNVKIGCFILLFFKTLSILSIILFYALCLYAGLVYSCYI